MDPDWDKLSPQQGADQAIKTASETEREIGDQVREDKRGESDKAECKGTILSGSTVNSTELVNKVK